MTKDIQNLYPKVTARLDSSGLSYELIDYKVQEERQTPFFGTIYSSEPIPTNTSAVFSLGLGETLWAKSGCIILSTGQITNELFETKIIDVSKTLTSVDYFLDAKRITAKELLERISSFIGLELEVIGELPNEKFSVCFLDSLKNALDQIKLIFKLEDARYKIDTLNKILKFYTTGKIIQEPLEITPYLLVEEKESSVVLRTLPMLQPFLPVLWRNEEKIIDRVIHDGKSLTSEVFFRNNQSIKGLFKRAFPGLESYTTPRMGKILKTSPGEGKHSKETPIASVDLELVDHNYQSLGLQLRKVPFCSPSKFIHALPNKGDFCLIDFIGGLATQPHVTNIFFDNQKTIQEDNTIIFNPKTFKAASEEIELGQEEEKEPAVKGDQLKTILEEILNLLSSTANSVCAPGNTLNSSIAPQVEHLKQNLDTILSNNVSIS